MRLVVALAFVTASASADPGPPHGARHVAIDYETDGCFHRDHRSYTLDWNGTSYSTAHGTVDARFIDNLYAALGNTRETPFELSCGHKTTHTKLTVFIDGDEPLELASKSLCRNFAPWNIKSSSGKLLVQFDGRIWQSLSKLITAIDPEGIHDDDDGRDAIVELGAYQSKFGVSSGEAEQCARSVEANAQLRKLFGAITVTSAFVYCKLGDTTDCATDFAAAEFQLHGVDATLEVDCNHGVASLTPKTFASYAKLVKFIDSKPVRDIVAGSAARAQVVIDGVRWSVTGTPPQLESAP